MRKNWSSVRQKWVISESNEESSATRTFFFKQTWCDEIVQTLFFSRNMLFFSVSQEIFIHYEHLEYTDNTHKFTTPKLRIHGNVCTPTPPICPLKFNGCWYWQLPWLSLFFFRSWPQLSAARFNIFVGKTSNGRQLHCKGVACETNCAWLETLLKDYWLYAWHRARLYISRCSTRFSVCLFFWKIFNAERRKNRGLGGRNSAKCGMVGRSAFI